MQWKKVVISFSDANIARFGQGFNYDEMGRYLLKRYIRIAKKLLDRMRTIVVFENDQVPQRLVFRGLPRPDSVLTVAREIRMGNRTLQVPTYRYYSSDLGGWYFQLRIPYPRGTTAEMAFREISSILPEGNLVHLRGNTVCLRHFWLSWKFVTKFKLIYLTFYSFIF